MARHLLSLLGLFIFFLSLFSQAVYAADCTPELKQKFMTLHATECAYTFTNEKDSCLTCIEQCGTWTVFGCLPSDVTAFSTYFVRFALGIGGGLAFLMMLVGAFTVITSSGDPERLKQGKATITKAALGLLLIIFSVFILQLIGKELFNLPGL